MKPINAELKSRIVRHFLTLSNCARVLDVTPPTVWRWTRGENLPDYETARKLCKLLNCELADIFQNAKWAELRQKK